MTHPSTIPRCDSPHPSPHCLRPFSRNTRRIRRCCPVCLHASYNSGPGVPGTACHGYPLGASIIIITFKRIFPITGGPVAPVHAAPPPATAARPRTHRVLLQAYITIYKHTGIKAKLENVCNNVCVCLVGIDTADTQILCSRAQCPRTESPTVLGQ